MQASYAAWWRRHGWTVAILLSAFGMAFAIRTIWTYPVIQQFGALYSYAGGSDSYYHSRVTTFIILNHRNLVYDPLIHFPVGGYNPREPLFDWMNAILGIVFAPFFGGNAVVAGAWFLDLQGPLWAALGVFPVYLIGREVASKRTGLIAAMIFPFLSANIDSSIFGYANYLSFYTFVILVTVYSYIRTVKAVGSRRWIADYRHPSQYWPGLRAFLRTERTAVKWAVFTGVSMGALALAWQGYTYGIVVICVSLLIAMIIERVRRVDSFGLYVTTWIVGLIGFPMAMPYYLVQHQFTAWFDLPLLLFFGTLGLLLPFLLMRDVPWVVSIPSLGLLVVAAAAFLAVVEPRYFTSIVTGQGYFVKNLIYSTVAEAQAPSIDQLVVGYGVVTFFLAFAGVAIFVYTLVKGRFKRHHIVFLVFAILSIYLPISAAKFFLLGSPAFALLPAEAIRRALDVGGYPELRRTVASLSDRRSQLAAFRKAFKVRHVLIFVLVLVLVLPNVWIGIDAGIPGNTKDGSSAQVYDSLPSFLRGNSSTIDNYFGAAGTSIDTSNQYDSAGYNWLAGQQTNVPEADRPAFVSWWDYGFQAIDQGQHPSVADNFQNGIDPAGQFLLAQNESNAIAILITTLLQAEQLNTSQPYLPAALNADLAQDGLNVTQLHNLMVNESGDVALVVNNPDRYLPVNPSTLTEDNAMYMAMSYFIATSLPLSGVATVYNSVQAYTGWAIRYDMTDSRLIPFSGQSTGIYYAPADLTGRVINAAGLPTTYFNVTVLGSDGNYYSLGNVPADVQPVNYYVNYFPPFYDSMIYRTYFGYNGTDVGLGVGIPGLEGSVQNDSVEPGWMLQHFEVVYKTAYYCPSKSEAANNSNCYVAMNQPSAISLAKSQNGSALLSSISYFQGGESMLEYYPGQTLLGTLQLADGTPVSGVRVTVDDGWGIPHDTAITAADGSFSLVLPPGNDTLNVTTGTFQGLSQQGNIVLKSIPITISNAVGLSYSAPNLPMTITVPSAQTSGFVYFNAANNTTYLPQQDPVVAGAHIVLWGPNNLTTLTATTDASGAFSLPSVPPGVYNYNVLYAGHNYTESPLYLEPSSPANATVGLPTGAVTGSVVGETGSPIAGAVVTLAGPTGAVASNTTNASGGFRISNYAPGNYTLTATVPGTSNRSVGLPVSVTTPTSGLVANLTVQPVAQVSVTVEANGAPVAGIPVRLTAVPVFATGQSPIATLTADTANATVGTSGPNGVVSLYLPYGNYSVAALGYVGSNLYAGVGTALAAPFVPSASVTLSLGPAIRLSGTVATTGAAVGLSTAVLAYGSDGAPTVTWATNGSYSLYLPAGSYSVLALQATSSNTSSVYAALSGVALSYPLAMNLVPSVAISAQFAVVASSGPVLPASGALVTVGTGGSGPAVTAHANANGTVVVYVPSALPISATSYCVGATSTGFAAASECGITPNGLSAMSKFGLPLTPVALTVTARGVPTGTSVTLNVTGTSATSVNRTLTGGPTFTTTVTPGTYSLSAWAGTGQTSVVYQQSSLVNLTVPLGTRSLAATVVLVTQVNSTGTVTLPSGAALGNVSVSLSSATFNTTVNGTAYTNGFYLPAGAYSAMATVTVGSTTFSNLELVSAGSRKVTPTVTLPYAAVPVNGTLTAPNGARLVASTTATLTGPSGASARVRVTSGNFSVELPGGASYSVGVATVSTPTQSPAGTYQRSWSVRPGATCVLGTTATNCSVPMVPTTQLVWLNGTLTAAGVPGAISGTVRLYGPSPNTTLVTTPATNGSFSVRVLPGVYSLYATGGGGSEPLAVLMTVPASLTAPNPIAVRLASTWSETVTVTPPIDGGALLGPANVTITSASGVTVSYPGVTLSTPFTVALPVGTYTVAAQSFGAPYRIATNATASAPASIVAGNAATVLVLAYSYVTAAKVTAVGSSSATITSPGTATFAFSVRNTGNEPILVHPVGSPAYWNFSFSFSNVTLGAGPGAPLLSATVTIGVPPDTSTPQPHVVVSIELANGTVVGSYSPSVSIVAYYGVLVGPAVGSPAQVGLHTALVPFYVKNTGNAVETVALSVVDASRIESQGWTVAFRGPSAPLTSPSVSVTPFANETYFVNFSANASVFVPVGSFTLSASVTNVSGAYQSSTELTLPIATVSVTTSNGTAPATVTGPGVGPAPSTLPDWVVPLLSFVPAIALVVGVIAVRWWRTRRWKRA
jgi:dolichyl-phosphooligosaccharide-protein glycotransferase